MFTKATPVLDRGAGIVLIGALSVLFALCFASVVKAQFWPFSGGLLVSYDGRWLAPVEETLLSSHEDDHVERGSVYAWDVTLPFGSPVYPMVPGRVTYAGCNNNVGGYGCWAHVTHDDGYSAIYAHLIAENNGQIWVNIGDQVGKWTPLGRIGWTGMTSFGPHIHWEIHHTSNGAKRAAGRFGVRFGRIDWGSPAPDEMTYFNQPDVTWQRFADEPGNP